METLEFRLPSRPCATGADPVLNGVVGSGNLEVLVIADAAAAADPGGEAARHCTVTITTSAVGFGPTWQAVLADFAARHAAGGTRITIHDVGATPAVVSLRLAQALRDYEEGSA